MCKYYTKKRTTLPSCKQKDLQHPQPTIQWVGDVSYEKPVKTDGNRPGFPDYSSELFWPKQSMLRLFCFPNQPCHIYLRPQKSDAFMDDMYDTVYFDELGITRLFVDEAHNFKNVPFETKANKVLGISGSGSKRCQDMMDKVHMVQKKNDGKGVVLATGTPITNSITDAYIMQQYLQSGELAMLDLQSFDAWIGMFAERSTEFEIDVDTSSYRLAIVLPAKARKEKLIELHGRRLKCPRIVQIR